jgi:predicted TIM-barrel fold metal-dependent hydrolase
MPRTAPQPPRFDPCGWAHAPERAAAGGAGAPPSGHSARRASDFGWAPGWAARLPRDDGSAPHLAALKALGLDGYVDAHTHWFPDNVNAKIWAYFDAHYWPVTYRFDTERRLEWLRRNGVRRFTTLAYAHRPGMAEWLNAWTREFCGRVPEAIPCATFYPEPEAAAYVRRAIEQDGVRGFKIHARVGGFDLSGTALTGVLEQIAAAALPVVLHVGDAPDAGPFTVPEVVDRLLARHPALRLIIAHMGASQFGHYLSLAERHPTVALDTTMVFVGFTGCDPFPPALLPRVEALSERVLFGSDFPTIPYPLSHAVLSLLDLPLSDAAKRRLLRDNAATWFGVTV